MCSDNYQGYLCIVYPETNIYVVTKLESKASFTVKSVYLKSQRVHAHTHQETLQVEEHVKGLNTWTSWKEQRKMPFNLSKIRFHGCKHLPHLCLSDPLLTLSGTQDYCTHAHSSSSHIKTALNHLPLFHTHTHHTHTHTPHNTHTHNTQHHNTTHNTPHTDTDSLTQHTQTHTHTHTPHTHTTHTHTHTHSRKSLWPFSHSLRKKGLKIMTPEGPRDI